MPSFERGVYEPPSDDVRVYDEEDHELDEEGSRLPLLIVIALMVLAAFGGVVWLAYNQGMQRGRADAPRMIVAASGPVRDAGPQSSDASHGLKIYQQPAPADDEGDSESTPPPTQAAKSAPMTAQAAPTTAPVVPATKPLVAEAAPVPKPVEKPVVTAMKPAPVPVKPAAVPPVPKATAAPTPLVAATKTEAPPKPVVTAPPPVTEAKPVASAGAYALQIGAYKSQSDADGAWKAFVAKHPIAGGYSEDVRRADLGDKGVWYRLRIGSFADKAAASSFCDKLKADGGTCLLAK